MASGLAASGYLGSACAEESASVLDWLFGNRPKRPKQVLDLAQRTDRKVAFGSRHMLFATPGGLLLGLGDNDSGQLGQATLVRQTSSGTSTFTLKGRRFTRVVPIEPSGVVAVAAYADSSLYLKKDGTVWGMGNLFNNVLGLGATGTMPVPQALGGLTDIVDIALSEQFGAAVRKDGSVFVWGNNFFGEAGIMSPGFGYQKGPPLPVPTPLDLTTGMVSCAGSANHLYLLDAEGFVHSPTHARTGAARRIEEEWVRLEVADVRSIHATASSSTVFGITRSGDVYAWGYGKFYGNGAMYSDHRGPLLIPELKGAQQIAICEEHAAAVMPDGRVIAWGGNGNFNLALPPSSLRERAYPDPIPVLKGAREIYAGKGQTVVLTEDQRYVFWGNFGVIPDVQYDRINYIALRDLHPAAVAGQSPAAPPAPPAKAPG